MNEKQKQAAELVLHQRNFIAGVALKYAPSADLVDDIAHEVLLEFITKAKHWNLEADIRPILVTLVQRHAARLWMLRQKTLPETLQKIGEHVRRRSENHFNAERYENEKRVLEECFSVLPPDKQLLLRLYYFEGKSTRELALMLDVQPETINRSISRIRMKLKEIISRKIQNEADHD